MDLASPNAPHERKRWRLRAQWRIAVRRFARNLDHGSILHDVVADGGLSGRYLIMCALSAAIATLGLMLSSPAVVIGAMLLSPLMGPIILLGFAFWTVDWPATRRALVALAIGMGIALLVAIALTAVLPLKAPTEEIISRTRPNLVDLMIAVFSGVAGAYAVIHRRGETAIGVAIATAIMPPIAAIGFGIGTTDWAISSGALLLFATNLVAIAISAALMAGLYGFHGGRTASSQGWIRHGAVLLVLAGLCVPLTVSLRTIALESRATGAVANAVKATFGPKARLASLKVRSAGQTVTVDGLVATPAFAPSATERLEQKLSRELQAKVRVRLDQVVMANPASLSAGPAEHPHEADLAQDLREAIPFQLDAVALDASRGVPFAMLSPASGLDLAGALSLEQGLRGRSGLERSEVIPPVQALAPIGVTLSSDAAAVDGAFKAQSWALSRWRAAAVRATLCGRARGRRASERIAQLLQQALSPASVEVVRSGAGCPARGPAAAFMLLSPAEPPPPPVQVTTEAKQAANDAPA